MNQKFKCLKERCIEKANYNYKTCTNPAYCYMHKSSDMVKFGPYTADDILYMIFSFF